MHDFFIKFDMKVLHITNYDINFLHFSILKNVYFNLSMIIFKRVSVLSTLQRRCLQNSFQHLANQQLNS